MAVIAFWGNEKEETAKTTSLVATTTLMTLENNLKCLVTSTEYNNYSLESCFWDIGEKKPELHGNMGGTLDSGIDGLMKLLKSNKITPELIPNYTKSVFKGRLEILFGQGNKPIEEYQNTLPLYKEIIVNAKEYYDLVFIDLSKETNTKLVNDILSISDIIVYTVSQRMELIQNYLKEIETNDMIDKKRVMVLLGRYDKFSKFNSKNVARLVGEKQVYSVPYNTLFFEACNDSTVANFFIKYRNIDESDRNFVFINEIRNFVNAIKYKIEELQMIR